MWQRQHYSLKRSASLRLLNYLLHGMALSCVGFSAASDMVKIFLAMGLLLSLIGQLRYTSPFKQLNLHGDTVQLITLADTTYEGVVLNSSLISPYAIFLHLQNPLSRKKSYCLLLWDVLPANQFRRLRVALKLL